MSTPDSIPSSKDLNARADALAKEAKQLRQKLLDQVEQRSTDLGIERDRVARQKYAAEQEASSADIQVKRERANAKTFNDKADADEARAVEADRRGDHATAADYRDNVATQRRLAESHESRARQAEVDAADLRVQASEHAKTLLERENAIKDFKDQAWEADQEIDKIEVQVNLLHDTAHKVNEFRINEDIVPGSMKEVDEHVKAQATRELEIEKSLKQIDSTEIDRSRIAPVVPGADVVTQGNGEPTAADVVQDAVESAADTLGIDDVGAGVSVPGGADQHDPINAEAETETDSSPASAEGTSADGASSTDDSRAAQEDGAGVSPQPGESPEVDALGLDSIDVSSGQHEQAGGEDAPASDSADGSAGGFDERSMEPAPDAGGEPEAGADFGADFSSNVSDLAADPQPAEFESADFGSSTDDSFDSFGAADAGTDFDRPASESFNTSHDDSLGGLSEVTD